jgi:hypothetical protein
MKRNKLTKEKETNVLVMSRRRCCICYGLNRDIQIKQGQIAHLDGNSSNDVLDNLVFLCLAHHDSFDTKTSQSKGITPHEVRTYRKELYEIIDTAWKQPLKIGTIEIPLSSDITGRYIRETDFESAEFEIKHLPSGRMQVSGLALWGTTRPYGPNIGELDFEASVADNSIKFWDLTLGGKKYQIELRFRPGGLIAIEQYVTGYFGAGASFAGEYTKITNSE